MMAIYIELTGRGDITIAVARRHCLRCVVLIGRGEEDPVSSTAAPLAGWWITGPSVFTHAVAIFIVGGVFDRTGPKIVRSDCDPVLSEGLPCISVFGSYAGVQHFHR